MHNTAAFLCFAFIGMAVVRGQVESACVLTVSSSKFGNLNGSKVKSAIKSSVESIAGDLSVAFHNGTDEVAILMCPPEVCEIMPDTLPGLLKEILFSDFLVSARYEKFSVGARAGCSYPWSCPFYYFNCRTKRVGGKNKCFCPSGSCWGR